VYLFLGAYVTVAGLYLVGTACYRLGWAGLLDVGFVAVGLPAIVFGPVLLWVAIADHDRGQQQ
jgi:hypothetical protein